ncbi:MAG: LacI family DNA-binding transcriptional regulator [Granulosicoccus sp.]|nr:LacI family DNA-binding transcriptional regulator [Granulosicoccus sp.]
MSRVLLHRPSIHDVAKEAGLSAATVSKVMRGIGNVRAENASRVNAVVESMGYRVDPVAADLRRGTRRIIGVVVPELESSFFGSLITSIESQTERLGYTLVMSSSRESETREKELIQRLQDLRVAGTILAPVRSETGSGAQLLKSQQMSAVLIDRVADDRQLDTVSVDNRMASIKVAQLLAASGHRHILILGLDKKSTSTRLRCEGFVNEFRQLQPSCRIDEVFTRTGLNGLRENLSHYFSDNRPTAIFSLFLNGTLLALSELRRIDLHCPDDISLIGFDDSEWMQAMHPAVTSVVQPVNEIAQQAVSLLMRRIHSGQADTVAHEATCHIEIRESVRALNQTAR